MEPFSYEWMKHMVVSMAFVGGIGIMLGTIVNGIAALVCWIVKKVRQHREKKLATVQTGEAE